MKVALFHGRGIVSALIRWQTRGNISHCAIVDDDGTVYESWTRGGVAKRDALKPGPGVFLYDVIGLEEHHKARVREYFQIHIAKKTPYDYWGVARFVTRSRKGAEPLGKESKLFCSECLYNAFGFGNFWLFAHQFGHLVHPYHLSWSTRLAGPPDAKIMASGKVRRLSQLSMDELYGAWNRGTWPNG